MPLGKAQREEGALGKGLGVSKGVAEEPDGIWGQIVGVGTKGNRVALKGTCSGYFWDGPGARCY